jgi:hypothetical protein
MQTFLEERGREAPELVRSAGALAGGIGGPGECGAVCASLMLLGLVHGSERSPSGLPRFVPLGQELLRRFGRYHGSTLCSEIGPKGLRACMRAMCTSPALVREVCAGEDAFRDSSPAQVEANLAVLAAFDDSGFHCADRVLEELDDVIAASPDLRRAALPFVGGMVLTGSTCGALAAGIMAIGAARGGIERSFLRTLRMVTLLVLDEQRAMADHVNAFNRGIRIGRALAQEFRERYGSTRCAELTGVDFTSPHDAARFRAVGLGPCEAIARDVAARVRRLLQEEESAR